MKGKKFLTLSLAFILSLSVFALFNKNANKVNAEEAATVENYSTDSTKWTSANNAVFPKGTISAAGAAFNWQTKALGANATVDLTVTESLELGAFSDWKFEYLTFSSGNSVGIDAANGNPTTTNSVSLVWGWVSGLSVVEIGDDGSVIYSKMAAVEASDKTFVPGNAGTDAEIIRQTPYYLFNKEAKFNVTIEGSTFNFRLVTKSPWGHDIDWTFSYTSENENLKGAKYATYGRMGSGTVDADHKILAELSIDGKKYASAADFVQSTNANFDNSDSMKASATTFNWQTTKVGNASTVDLTVTESLELGAFSDWKFEYLTFSNGNSVGIDAANGNPTTANSVSLVWGWVTGLSVVEIGADGTVTYSKMAALEESDKTFVPGNAGTDAEIIRQTPYYLFNKAARFVVEMNETEAGSVFNFKLVTKSPWGHDIDWTFSYTSTNENLKGDKFVTYGRTGSGAIDATHEIAAKLLVTDKKVEVKEEETSKYTNYSASNENWAYTSNVAFDGTTMSATAPQFDWVTNGIGGNSKIKLTVNESLELAPMGDWKYEFLTLTTGSAAGIDAGSGTPKTPNSVSLVWGWVSGLSVVEVGADGTVVYSKMASTAASDTTFVPENAGSDYEIVRQTPYNLFNKTAEFYCEMEEAETGVTFNFRLVTKSPWGHDVDWTFSYTSTNTELIGQMFVAYGRVGSGTVDADHKIVGKMEIENIQSSIVKPEPIEPGPDYVYISEDATKWVTLYNAVIEDKVLYQTGKPSLLVSKPFSGNAQIYVSLDYSKLEAGWGGMIVGIKGHADDFSNSIFSFDYNENKVIVQKTSGNWVALAISHAGYQILECENGVVKTSEVVLGAMNGYSFWYSGSQVNTITVTTTDNENGCEIVLAFKASGHASNDGNKYEATFQVNNKALWGDQSVAICYVVGQNDLTKENNTVTVGVVEVTDEYTYDDYMALKAKELIDAISYTSVTAENYSDVASKYEDAKSFYDALTAEQAALVSNELKNKLTQVKSDLDNVDVAVLVTLAIAKLPTEAYTRENYAAQKALVEDAVSKYEKLSDIEKANVAETDANKLKEAKRALALFEDVLKYADPVVELIEKINLPITNYGKDSRAIKAAKAAYDGLYDDEKAEVTNYNILEEAVLALKAYEDANKMEGYNFATNKDNFAEISGYEGMSVTDEGLNVSIPEMEAGIYITRKVENEETITYILDSALSDAAWGNYYFIFKADRIEKLHNKGSWAQEGNYAVLLIGSDGFKVIECIDGVLPMTKDSAGNPIADWTTTLEYPTDEEGATQYDVFYIYKNYTKLSIKTIDLYDGETYIGYKAIFTLVGGDTGATVVREYISTNVNVEGAGYQGLELFVGGPINEGNGNGFKVNGIYVSGVTEYDGAKAKEEIANKAAANAVDKLIEAMIADPTVDNYNQAKQAYETAKGEYDKLTDAQKAYVTADVTKFDAVKSSLDTLKALMESMEKADEVDALLEGLTTTINETNYNTIKNDLKDAKAKYEALSEFEKQMLTQDASILEACEKAIKAYEDEINNKTPDKPTEKEPSDKPSKSGCKQSLSLVALSPILLLGVAVSLKKKENE